MVTLLVIVSVWYTCRPPPRFDATDAAFPLTNRCKYISYSLVGPPPNFGSMSVGKSVRTPSKLLVSSAIIPDTIGGIYGGFLPWENSSNLLKI